MTLAKDQGAGAVAGQMLPKLLAPGALQSLPEVAARIRTTMENTALSGILGALGAMRDRVDSTPLLPTLSETPTLVVVGDQDQMTPPSLSRKIAEGIPGAVLSVIANAGHLPAVEQPIATTRVLAEFLESLR